MPVTWTDQTEGAAESEWDDGATEWDADGNRVDSLWDRTGSTTWTEV